MQRAFLWLSGADPAILRACHKLESTERIRFAGLGALLLIPAMLGFVAFSYAVSTVVHDWRLYLGAGALWAVVVLLIDRYLVATLFKSKTSSLLGRALTIFVRYLFAVVVGVAVAHPFTLLWFDASINQVIDDNRRTAVNDRLRAADGEKERLPKEALVGSSVTALTAERDAHSWRLRCLSTLNDYEYAGKQPQTTLDCGVPTGRAGCGNRCQDRDGQIADEKRAITALEAKITDATTREAEAGGRRDERIWKIDEEAQVQIADIGRTFSHDYLALVNALAQLEAKEHHVTYVKWFMILLFVFVDIMPITMKLATPRGEYEEIRDTRLLERRAIENARREVAGSGETERALAESASVTARLMGEVRAISEVPQRVIDDYTDNFLTFEEQVRRLRAAAGGDRTVLADLEPGIAALREMNGQARTTAFAKVVDHLRTR